MEPRSKSFCARRVSRIDPVLLCAEAYAGWHSSWLDAFDIPWVVRDGAWVALAPPPFIYLAGISVQRGAKPDTLATAPGPVLDAWSDLDLSALGLENHLAEPWYVRAPDPVAQEDPDELAVERVTDAAGFPEFEAVSVRGFGGEDATIEPGTIHPPMSDPRMVLWIGRVAGAPVGAAMSYRTDRAVGIFGVTVVGSVRGRGYGSALTRHALLLDHGLPAVLAPSPMAESMYSRLGFREVGTARHWRRPGPVSLTGPDAVKT